MSKYHCLAFIFCLKLFSGEVFLVGFVCGFLWFFASSLYVGGLVRARSLSASGWLQVECTPVRSAGTRTRHCSSPENKAYEGVKWGPDLVLGLWISSISAELSAVNGQMSHGITSVA